MSAPAAALPPEIAAHVPLDLKPYFVGFLTTPAGAKEMPFDLFVRHQAYMRDQFAAGVFHLAGPFTEKGRFRGMVILSASTPEEALAVLRRDPAVEAGIFSIEVSPAMFPNLAGLKVNYPPRAPTSDAGSGDSK